MGEDMDARVCDLPLEKKRNRPRHLLHFARVLAPRTDFVPIFPWSTLVSRCCHARKHNVSTFCSVSASRKRVTKASIVTRRGLGALTTGSGPFPMSPASGLLSCNTGATAPSLECSRICAGASKTSRHRLSATGRARTDAFPGTRGIIRSGGRAATTHISSSWSAHRPGRSGPRWRSLHLPAAGIPALGAPTPPPAPRPIRAGSPHDRPSAGPGLCRICPYTLLRVQLVWAGSCTGGVVCAASPLRGAAIMRSRRRVRMAIWPAVSDPQEPRLGRQGAHGRTAAAAAHSSVHRRRRQRPELFKEPCSEDAEQTPFRPSKPSKVFLSSWDYR